MKTAKKFVKLSDLTPDPRNARKHNERNLDMIGKSLDDYGPARSIVIDEKGVILAGNGVVEAARKRGMTRLKTVEVDDDEIIGVVKRNLTPKQKLELALFDNRTSETSEWDSAVIAALADEVDLEALGLFVGDELAELLARDAPQVDLFTDEDDVPAPPKVPKAKLGQVWMCGDHRVMCGDSTCADDVARLMAGQKADMVWTVRRITCRSRVESEPREFRVPRPDPWVIAALQMTTWAVLNSSRF